MTTAQKRPTKNVETRSNFERYAYLFMRLSGISLLILAVGHVILNLVLTGVHNLSLQLVADRWSSWGWRVYSMLLLIFAVTHGYNGFRNVLEDYIHNEKLMKVINVFLVIFIVATIAWSAVALASFPLPAG
jgi:succinate dehydrogenase / fumarate reductase membrane anchor subunit